MKLISNFSELSSYCKDMILYNNEVIVSTGSLDVLNAFNSIMKLGYIKKNTHLYIIVDSSQIENINSFRFKYRRLLRKENVSIYKMDCNGILNIVSSIITGDLVGSIRLDNDKINGEYTTEGNDIYELAKYQEGLFSFGLVTRINPL